VQQGLAAQLDMQAVYDLVGDKIRDIFDAQVVLIATYDHAAHLTTTHYAIEKGRRIYMEERTAIAAVSDHIIRTRQPLLINENMTERVAEFGMAIVPGTELPLSTLDVPLIAGNQVIGVISLQNIDASMPSASRMCGCSRRWRGA